MTAWKFVKLSRSPNPEKKWRVRLYDASEDKEAHVDFGAKGYDDFTIHGDNKRKMNYIARHSAREDWKRSGLLTAGFWSRWVLWNLPTIEASLADTLKRFDLPKEKTSTRVAPPPS